VDGPIKEMYHCQWGVYWVSSNNGHRGMEFYSADIKMLMSEWNTLQRVIDESFLKSNLPYVIRRSSSGALSRMISLTWSCISQSTRQIMREMIRRTVPIRRIIDIDVSLSGVSRYGIGPEVREIFLDPVRFYSLRLPIFPLRPFNARDVSTDAFQIHFYYMSGAGVMIHVGPTVVMVAARAGWWTIK
jgi:hypothetical protein